MSVLPAPVQRQASLQAGKHEIAPCCCLGSYRASRQGSRLLLHELKRTRVQVCNDLHKKVCPLADGVYICMRN